MPIPPHLLPIFRNVILLRGSLVKLDGIKQVDVGDGSSEPMFASIHGTVVVQDAEHDPPAADDNGVVHAIWGRVWGRGERDDDDGEGRPYDHDDGDGDALFNVQRCKLSRRCI